MIRKEICKIISQKEIAQDIYELTVAADFVKEIRSPGQFVHIRVTSSWDPLLRRPISISSYDDEKFTMIYRKEGHGTAMLAEMNAGMELDILGPLGKSDRSHVVL